MAVEVSRKMFEEARSAIHCFETGFRLGYWMDDEYWEAALQQVGSERVRAVLNMMIFWVKYYGRGENLIGKVSLCLEEESRKVGMLVERR